MPSPAEKSGDTVQLSNGAWARLHEVCLRGMCGAPHDDDDGAALISAGFVRAAPGGLTALPAGRAALREWACLSEEAEAHATVRQAYLAFVPLDSEIEHAVAAWQQQGAAKKLRLDRQAKDVLTQLRTTHARIAPTLDALGLKVPRFAGYRARLQAALTQVEAGHHEYLAGVMVDSYHTVWWHLHQDLVWAVGLQGPEIALDAEAQEIRLEPTTQQVDQELEAAHLPGALRRHPAPSA